MNWERLEGIEGLICGVDEVGRGCLAGPVVSCAVIMPEGRYIEGVRDSKKLTAKKREHLAPLIRESAIAIGIGMLEPQRIDEIGIRNAVRETMRLAIQSILNQRFDIRHIAVDYESVPVDIPQSAVVHGDDRIYEIACASILAKVYRDSLAIEWESQYPGYHFANNKGYGTAAHQQGIVSLGLTPIHRRSFCKKYICE